MYISANKVNVTHSYTPQQGSTSPSTAGQEEAFGPPSWPKLKKQNSLMKAHVSTQRKLSEGCPVCRRWTATSLIFKKKMKIFQLVQKPLYLPDR